MENKFASHPFVESNLVKRTHLGYATDRIDHTFKMAAFCEALAPLVGGTIKDRSDEIYAVGRICINDELFLSITSQHGAKMGRVEIGGGSGLNHKLYQFSGSTGTINLPSATYDAARPLETIAKLVKKNIIDASASSLDTLRERVAVREKNSDEFGELVSEMQKAFPKMTIDRRNETDMSANIYLNTSRGYVSGTLHSGGSIYFERVRIEGEEDRRAFLEMLNRD